MHSSRFIIASALVASSVASGAYAQANDILGVAVGMTLKEVTDALQKANPKFGLETLYYAGPDGKPANVASIRACASSEANDTKCTISYANVSREVITITFGAAIGKAFHVTRRWEPGQSERPLVTAFNEALQKKYGKLEKEREFPDGGSYGNYPNSQGKQDRQCRPFDPEKAPKEAKSNCGLAIFLSGAWDPKTNILRTATTTLFDHRVLVADIKQGNASAAIKQQAEDAAKAAAAQKAQVKL